jgi:hypothetical protein
MPERSSRVRFNLDGPGRPELKIDINGGPESARRSQRAGVAAVSNEVVWPETDLDLREAYIRERVDYLNSLREQAHQAGSYRNLLSGESSYSEPPAGQGEISDKKILSQKGLLDRRVPAFGGVLLVPGQNGEPGIDYKKLKAETPEDQYKFYSSFNLSTARGNELGNQWFSEVVDRASESRISLKTKSFDHAYDSLNLYTWHPEQLTGILQELYPRYLGAGLYNDTPHFFQGAIDGINPDHVGYVQEPACGWPVKGHSFSSRMGLLGGALDDRPNELITPERFIEAAAVAGVDPARPYLIDPSAGAL